MTRSSARLAALVPLVALALTGCGGDAGADAAADGELTVLASTNVYGDIASSIGGDLVTVTSVITSSTQDPHEYEATAQDRVALDQADVVITNGGGYDEFMETLLDGSDSDPVVLDAVTISGLAPEDGEHSDDEEHSDEEGHDHIEGFNEHVWYDFHAVEELAEQISQELAGLDPDNASTYEDNHAALAEDIESLEASAEEMASTADGRGVAITEPVPVYLLAEVGLDNLTPEEFSEAVEEGADVPPRVLQETLDLFDGDEVSVLAYNAQAADGTTEQVRSAAEAAGVPVVEFTETLPEGLSYVGWQQQNLDDLAAALG